MSSSDEELRICSSAFIVMSSKSRRKKRKLRWPINSLLKNVHEPGSSGSIVSGYGLDDRGSFPGRGKGFFLCTLRPDRLWDPPGLLFNGYRGPFPGVKCGRGVMLTTHPHLVPRSRKRGAIPPLPIRLNGVQWDSFSFFKKVRGQVCLQTLAQKMEMGFEILQEWEHQIFTWCFINISTNRFALLNSTFVLWTTRHPCLNEYMNRLHN
jgi:hypothetical protein